MVARAKAVTQETLEAKGFTLVEAHRDGYNKGYSKGRSTYRQENEELKEALEVAQNNAGGNRAAEVITELEGTVKGLTEKVKSLTSDLSKADASNESLYNEKNDLQKKFVELRRDNDDKSHAIADAAKKIVTLQQVYDDFKVCHDAEVADLTQELSKLEEKKNELRKDLLNSQKREGERKTWRDYYEAEAKTFKAEAERLGKCSTWLTIALVVVLVGAGLSHVF